MRPFSLRLCLLVLAPVVGLLVVGPVGAEEEQQSAESQQEEAHGDSEESRFKGERISLSLRDADLREVLLSFAELADVDMVIDPDIQGKVTVELEDVPWDQALAVILKSQGLGIEISSSDARLWSIDRER